jgi:signal transduction histidine kinase
LAQEANNSEMKSLTTKMLLVMAIFMALTAYVLRRETEALNREYIRQNIATAGAVIQRYPELEEELVSNITSGYEKNYEYGKAVMQKYSYDERLKLEKNRPVRAFYYKALASVLLMVFIGFIFIHRIVMMDLGKVFGKIRSFSEYAEAVVEGNYETPSDEYREGDLYIFSHQFNLMASRLRESIESLKKEKLFLKDTITNISHQLKTPVASLIMFNEILKNDEGMDCEERRNFVDMSLVQLERMEWLIKNLLKLARLDAGVVDFKLEQTIINETIQKALNGIETKAKAKNQSIIIKGSGAGVLKHDSDWTAEALSNIIKNSIERTAEGGEINITWEETPLSIQIAVQDNGQGIPEDEIGKVFRRFYKGKTSVNPASVGIGLALTKVIVESQGGTITVTSKEGVGTEFRMSFLKTVL